MILIKNVSLLTIEIEDIGISIDADEIYDISDDNPASPGLKFHVDAGNIVYMDPENPAVALDQSESQQLFQSFDLTNFYRKEEIDALILPFVASANVYLKTETYNTGEVDVIFDGIVNNAPALLDTLSELSTALGNDANFATTITNQIAGKANIAHDHDSSYYTQSLVDGFLLLKANVIHNHNSAYAPIGHNHDSSYAPLTHNHNSQYASLAHNHDSSYAPIGHNHDLIYAPISHNHNNIYYTQSQVDALVAAAGLSNYNYFASPSVTTTDSESFVTKIEEDITIASGQQGRYRIGWCYLWNCNSTGRDFRAQVVVNDTVIFEHRQEPKDAGGSFGSTGTDQKHPASGFAFVNLPVGSTHIHINLATSDDDKVVSMWNVALEMWKI